MMTWVRHLHKLIVERYFAWKHIKAQPLSNFITTFGFFMVTAVTQTCSEHCTNYGLRVTWKNGSIGDRLAWQCVKIQSLSSFPSNIYKFFCDSRVRHLYKHEMSAVRIQVEPGKNWLENEIGWNRNWERNLVVAAVARAGQCRRTWCRWLTRFPTRPTKSGSF